MCKILFIRELSAEWTSDARNLIILISYFLRAVFIWRRSTSTNPAQTECWRRVASVRALANHFRIWRTVWHTHTHTICEMIPNTFPNFIPNSSPVEFFDGANARNIFNEIQTKAATETDKMNANVNSYGQIVKMPKIEKWEKKRERKKDKIFATMNSLIRSSMVFWEK